MTERTMPCGQCPAGTYAYGAVLGGVELFGSSPTQRDALRASPRCKSRPWQICAGCRDFIRSAEFPMNVPELLADLVP